jgi:hypothetical protein
MNRFQAMAQIMAVICENSRLQPGTREYRATRKIVSRKIDQLGPKAALEQAIKWKGHILDQARVEDILEELKGKFPYLNF